LEALCWQEIERELIRKHVEDILVVLFLVCVTADLTACQFSD
jgi:hypothetical protein